MKVILLGTNGWYSTQTGDTVCTLLKTGAFDIVLDAGSGFHRALGHLDGRKPTFLFLSHFHIDHISGLHMLSKYRFAEGLVICGPAGSRETLGVFCNTPFTVPLAQMPFPVRVCEMPAEQAVLPFSVEALPLRHATLTLGYRIGVEGRTIAYCPDTGYCDNAVLLARSADLLIAECAFRKGQVRESWPHLNPETAARIAREAGARRLVLTHFDAGNYPSLAERKEAEAVAAGGFPGAAAGQDGMEIAV